MNNNNDDNNARQSLVSPETCNRLACNTSSIKHSDLNLSVCLLARDT